MSDERTKEQRDKLLKALAEGARIREVDADKLNDTINRTKEQKAFDAHLDELAMNHEFKPRPYSFKREMVAFEEIHHFLYSMMSDAITKAEKHFKEYVSHVDSLQFIEENLTPAEFFTLEAFYNWIERGDKYDNVRTFGDNNYNERYKEWLLTLPRIKREDIENA